MLGDQRSGMYADGHGDSNAQMTLEQQKAELKRRIMAQPSRKPKLKKEKKDTVYNPESKSILRRLTTCLVHDNESPDEIADRAARKKRGQLYLNDYHILSTLGTGTFGRVRLVKHRSDPPDADPLALKCLKKSAIIKLK